MENKNAQNVKSMDTVQTGEKKEFILVRFGRAVKEKWNAAPKWVRVGTMIFGGTVLGVAGDRAFNHFTRPNDEYEEEYDDGAIDADYEVTDNDVEEEVVEE